MAILGHPESGGGPMQRQDAVGRRALRHKAQVGNAESCPELVGDFEGARFARRHGQGFARELLFECGLKRNGGGAQQVEQGDCLGGGDGSTVDRLDLFE